MLPPGVEPADSQLIGPIEAKLSSRVQLDSGWMPCQFLQPSGHGIFRPRFRQRRSDRASSQDEDHERDQEQQHDIEAEQNG